MFGWKAKSSTTAYRMAETSGSYNGGQITAHGLTAGTRVASNLGWRDVAALTVGDKVLTFDNGMQVITEIRRNMIWVDAIEVPVHAWPVHIPQDVLGNRVAMTLMPDQGVMIETDAAADAHGDPFAVVPAVSLDGVMGVTRVAPREQVEMITLFFADEEVIYAECGALMHCPRSHVSLGDMLTGQPFVYDVHDEAHSTFLVECWEVENAQGAVAHMPDAVEMAVAS